MLSRTLNQVAQSPWAKLVWAGVGVLVLIQMVVFYKLCTSQVDRAHARETMAVQQRNALTDCLDYGAKSTISSCSRMAGRSAAGQDASLLSRDLPRAGEAILGSIVPVSYVFH